MTTTAGTTSRGYRYPGDASATDVPGDLKKLADDVNADVTAVAANGAVTTAKIADSAVTSAKIADGTIVAGDLADGAVTSAKIADGTIATGDLADSAVTSAKIADGTIATADLADGAVTSAKIADGTIVAGDLADSAVTSAKIADGTIATGDLADSAVTSAKIAAGTIVSSDLATSAVATSNIADSAVTSAKIADGTIVNADINAAAAIDVSKLSGVVASAGVGNLLPANVATGTDTLLDISGFNAAGNFTATSDTEQRSHGSRSLKLVSVVGGSPYVSHGGTVVNGTIPVTAGATYTLSVMAMSTTSTRTFAARVYWYRPDGSQITFLSGAYTPLSPTWRRYSVTTVAPPDAVTASIMFIGASLTVGETLWTDSWGFWQGAGGAWAPPGSPIVGLGTYADESVGRRIFTWDDANARWQQTYGDTGWREVNALQTPAALTKFPNAVLSLRRVNSSVDVRWFSDTGTVAGAAGTAICSTLTGFRPGVIQGRGIVGSAVNASSGLPSVHGVYSDGAALNIATTADSANNVLASLSYTTNDSWPTALPGNAIGTIPQ